MGVKAKAVWLPMFVGASLAISVLAAGTASGAVNVSGSKSCGANQTGKSYAYSTGRTEHYPPGGGYGIFRNGINWRDSSQLADVTRGGSWHVVSAGSLNATATYAKCITTGTAG